MVTTVRLTSSDNRMEGVQMGANVVQGRQWKADGA